MGIAKSHEILEVIETFFIINWIHINNSITFTNCQLCNLEMEMVKSINQSPICKIHLRQVKDNSWKASGLQKNIHYWLINQLSLNTYWETWALKRIIEAAVHYWEEVQRWDCDIKTGKGAINSENEAHTKRQER